ncbi:putative membrane protein YphA (DoxX/SURF4 family) [Pedobacter sp. AK017]|uniref:MauE/DoxX family redox-associated membrane protein n=1 Tax=Pedobacter sp. AK017 TaxID=2723073 RepID=UPI001854A0A9|nr:MauE/DoxX family redox-associated membrane protein [Pedobacter sp. AK017]MBB5440105.1 putative membrane protein YphA (DoxX/SURF4 family) [Pedobacter sp. AK017]
MREQEKAVLNFNQNNMNADRKRYYCLMLLDAVRYLFILLFLYAAFSKLYDFQKFKVQLGQSPILSDFTLLVALLVPGVEVLIAIGLAFRRSLLPALWASYGLMWMFIVYIIVILKFTDRPVCNCGGVLEQMSWDVHLLFNMGFVVLSWIGLGLGLHQEGRFWVWHSSRSRSVFVNTPTRHAEPRRHFDP